MAVFLLPDLEQSLRALDDSLRLLPMRASIVLGIMEYGGVEHGIRRFAAGLGVGFALAGTILLRGSLGWRNYGRNREQPPRP